MIRYMTGDLFESGVQALVNPVNCQGVMGAGLAKAFKERFPENFEAYKEVCELNGLEPGGTYTMFDEDADVYIINLSTKNRWREPSRLEWVGEGLEALRDNIVALEITSVALPALGCGLGDLRWSDVKPMIEGKLGDLNGVEVIVYEPGGGKQW